MSGTVDNLKLLGKALSEVGQVVGGVFANGSDYLADLVYLPELVGAGEDIASALKNAQADLDEVKSLDEASRAELAAAWQADIPALSSKTIGDTLAEGVTILTYVLEAVGYFLRTWPAKAVTP